MIRFSLFKDYTHYYYFVPLIISDEVNAAELPPVPEGYLLRVKPRE
jgi:hypothetical protein